MINQRERELSVSARLRLELRIFSQLVELSFIPSYGGLYGFLLPFCLRLLHKDKLNKVGGSLSPYPFLIIILSSLLN
jgi:hypothetical protein